MNKSTATNNEAYEEKLWDLSDQGISLTSEEEKKMLTKDFTENCWEANIFVDGKILQGFVPLSTVLVFYNFKETDVSRFGEALFTSEICDIPEDIGIFSGVDMLQSKDTVTWTTSDLETKKRWGTDKFEFYAEEMKSELEAVWRTLYFHMEEDIMSDELLYFKVSETIKIVKTTSPQYYLSIWDANKKV